MKLSYQLVTKCREKCKIANADHDSFVMGGPAYVPSPSACDFVLRTVAIS